ncbi:hypothetical protein DES37_110144 [Mangrovibacter plantisponsor]|uniref:Chalcone isomerase-like protein n=2 Tax=Mangrovibacter plantisponsor TaxID=451513 RepID=A0A317PVN7_9ENTR|nr:hypothetical protein DES37_110144 [Mangrovibacter plantisponsor]
MNSIQVRNNRLNTLSCIVALLASLLMPVVTQAADWLRWRNVGAATFTWGPFTLYHARLLSPDGRYHGLSSDLALVITYQRAISHTDLVDATRDQWQELGILQATPQSTMWLQALEQLWPDVTPGSQLAFVATQHQGQFWYRAGSATPFSPLGPQQPSLFSERFLAIWLDPRTAYPNLRQQLTGEKP